MNSNQLDNLEGDKQISKEINEEINKEDYFNVDAESSSRFNSIDPSMGGSPKKYLAFISSNEEREESVDMERGSLIHKYVENPNKFIILEVDKPSDKLGEVADLVISYKKEMETLREEDRVDMDKTILAACRNIGWNTKYGDEAILKNTQVIRPYIEQMLQPSISNKIVMIKKTKEVVTNCVLSLEIHEVAKKHLFREKEEGVQIYKETKIYWEIGNFKCKAKPDNFTLDFNNKKIILDDLKSGSFNISNYENTFKYRRTYRQLAWYKKAIIEFTKQHHLIPENDLPNWNWEFNIIAVETKDEFRTAVFKIGEPWIFKGKNEYEALLARIAFHRKNGFDMTMEEYNNNGYMILNNPEE